MDDPVSVTDVINCYRLALGRDPESDAVVADKLTQPRGGLLPDFFSSGEFAGSVRPAMLDGALRQPAFRTPPDAAFKAWVATFSPLSPEGGEAVRAAASWRGLYHALFADPVFAGAVLAEAARRDNPAFLGALAARDRIEAASHIEGRVELVAPHEIRGWALDRDAPDRRLVLELRVDERLLASTVTAAYRPELQARFGGAGRFGFVLPRPPAARDLPPCTAELREAATGALVEVFQLTAAAPPRLDALTEVRREIAEVRSLLARIEGRLPAVQEAFSFALDTYGDYYETYYAPAARSSPQGGEPLEALTAVVDATRASPGALDLTLASLARQGRRPAAILAVHPAGDAGLDFEAALRLWRGRLGPATQLEGVAADGGWAAAMEQAARAAATPRLLLLCADALLAPDAAEALDRALSEGAALAYADEDEVELSPDGREGRHARPRLRAAFDRELLLQQDGLGELLAVPRDLALAVGWRREAQAGAGAFDFTLRLAERVAGEGLVHLPRVLAHRTTPRPDPPAAALLAAVQEHLRRAEPDSEVAPHRDELGAEVPGARRVRRRPPAGTRAAVIVPTRDRAELIGPCLASLVARLERNATSTEILVVDNQGREGETEAVLQAYARTAPVRVLRHDGAFNWALINNRAAAETEADVLIFLNNDTAMVTADWCDELCSQAMRPEVGVVGARLLYADGTLQHAGVVTGGVHAFTAHEGVGRPGADPGHLGRHALLHQASAVTGACLATRAEVFRRLGGFDAVHLPIEGNDVDYCFRVRAEGLAVLYDPYCTLHHFESKTRGYNLDADKQARADAAGAVLRARWSAAYAADPFYNPHFDRTAPPFTRLRPAS